MFIWYSISRYGFIKVQFYAFLLFRVQLFTSLEAELQQVNDWTVSFLHFSVIGKQFKNYHLKKCSEFFPLFSWFDITYKQVYFMNIEKSFVLKKQHHSLLKKYQFLKVTSQEKIKIVHHFLRFKREVK